MLSCLFFQFFYEKLTAVMPIVGQKNVNTDKTTLFYGPKKSIRCSSFRLFTKKSLLLCPYFVKKRPFSTKNLLSRPYSLKKMSILSKTLCSHVIFFFKFVKKKPAAVMPIFGQKNVAFVKTTIY